MHEKSVVRTVSEQWMDFRTIDKLSMISGVNERDLVKLAVKELVDNALTNADRVCLVRQWILCRRQWWRYSEQMRIWPITFGKKTVIFDEGIRLPTRGALGNGLRFVAGVALLARHIDNCVNTRQNARAKTPIQKRRDNIYKD